MYSERSSSAPPGSAGPSSLRPSPWRPSSWRDKWAYCYRDRAHSLDSANRNPWRTDVVVDWHLKRAPPSKPVPPPPESYPAALTQITCLQSEIQRLNDELWKTRVSKHKLQLKLDAALRPKWRYGRPNRSLSYQRIEWAVREASLEYIWNQVSTADKVLLEQFNIHNAEELDAVSGEYSPRPVWEVFSRLQEAVLGSSNTSKTRGRWWLLDYIDHRTRIEERCVEAPQPAVLRRGVMEVALAIYFEEVEVDIAVYMPWALTDDPPEGKDVVVERQREYICARVLDGTMPRIRYLTKAAY